MCPPIFRLAKRYQCLKDLSYKSRPNTGKSKAKEPSTSCPECAMGKSLLLTLCLEKSKGLAAKV